MLVPRLPPDEQERLAALRAFRILDTSADAAFDDLTRLTAAVCATPIALVSLIDEHRQWFKSRVGLAATETSRDVAFCAHAILGDAPLVVENATADVRFRDNPLVRGEPHIRFYAGAPLVDVGGHKLGTLCVIDRLPRSFGDSQVEMLAGLSRQVMHLIELHRCARQLADSLERARILSRLIPICMHCHDVRDEQDDWTRVEKYVRSVTGASFSHGICPACLQHHYGDLMFEHPAAPG